MKKKTQVCEKCYGKGYSSQYQRQMLNQRGDFKDSVRTVYCDCPAGKKAEQDGKQAQLL